MVIFVVQVTFQDFNEAVVSQITPNIVLKNLENWLLDSESVSPFPKVEKLNTQIPEYIYGDWSNLIETSSQIYSLILTSDTTYNPAKYCDLYKYIRANLAKDGLWICSTQVYYYGVGGGDTGFIDFIEKYGEINVTRKQEFSDGQSIDRVILYLKWIPEMFNESKTLPDSVQQEEEDFMQF